MRPTRRRLRRTTKGENGRTTVLPGGTATASNSIGKKKLRQRIVNKDGTLVPSANRENGRFVVRVWQSATADYAAVKRSGDPLVITSVCS